MAIPLPGMCTDLPCEDEEEESLPKDERSWEMIHRSRPSPAVFVLSCHAVTFAAIENSLKGGDTTSFTAALAHHDNKFEKKKAPRMRMGGGFCAHSPPLSFTSDRLRLARPLYHPDHNSEAFVGRSMRTKGLVPTLPDGTQQRPQSRPKVHRPQPKREAAAKSEQEAHRVSKAANKLSAEYIDNLQMQIQVRAQCSRSLTMQWT
jgi:hypothetical protein